MHLNIGRQGRLNRRQHLLDLGDGLDDVGAGQRKDDHAHRRHVVVEAGVTDILVGVLDVGYIMQQHRRAVAVGNHEVAIIRRLARLVVGDDFIALLALIDVALGAVGVGRGYRGAHVLEPDSVAIEFVGLELDPYRGQGAAAERDLADAGDLRELLLDDGIGRIIELRRGQRARGQRQDDDR